MQSNKYIDQKVTIWMRCHFTDDANMDNVVSYLKNGATVNEVCEGTIGFRECEVLYDTEGQLTIEQNDGDQTIEVYEGDKVIWQNNE